MFDNQSPARNGVASTTVENIEGNILEAEQETIWRQQYNEHLLQQRVREEIEKKNRFDELLKREIEREERNHKAVVNRDLDAIHSYYDSIRQLRKNAPEFIATTGSSIGNTILAKRIPELEILITVSSYGDLCVWRTREDLFDRHDFCKGPSLVDCTPLTKEPPSESMDIISCCCIVSERLHSHSYTISIFVSTLSGMGYITKITLEPEQKVLKHKLEELDRENDGEVYDPGADILSMKLDMENEGSRWIKSSEICVEKHLSNTSVYPTCSLSQSGILLITQDFVRCIDFDLKNMWVLQVGVLIPVPRQFPSRDVSANLNTSRRVLTCITAFDDDTFVLGMSSGEVVLMVLPKAPMIDEIQQWIDRATIKSDNVADLPLDVYGESKAKDHVVMAPCGAALFLVQRGVSPVSSLAIQLYQSIFVGFENGQVERLDSNSLKTSSLGTDLKEIPKNPVISISCDRDMVVILDKKGQVILYQNNVAVGWSKSNSIEPLKLQLLTSNHFAVLARNSWSIWRLKQES